MSNIRLGTLPHSKKWRDIIGLLDMGASIDAIAAVAARASETYLRRASDDLSFQSMTQLVVRLPLLARAPSFEAEITALGVDRDTLGSITGLLGGLSGTISQHNFELGRSSDAGELARAALLESLSV